MEYVIIPVIACIASLLTFFSGFGLGTLLLPVFAIYYPLEMAVALTAIVHLLNNVFKFGLVRGYVDRKIVLHFGVPSMLGAFAGAWLLGFFSYQKSVLFAYTLSRKEFFIHSKGVILGLLIVFFSIFELSKKLSSITFHNKFLIPGGVLSGFLGGLSGHQGALRSAFLLRQGLERHVFIASGVVIACMVDVARLSLYSNLGVIKNSNTNYSLLCLAVAAAWAGAWGGSKLFRKITHSFFKWLVGMFMLLMGALIAMGIID